MGGQLTLQGSLLSQSAQALDGSVLPASVITDQIATSQTPLGYQAEVYQLRNVVSPAAFVALSGLGATDNLTRGKFLYVRANADVQYRLTFVDPLGGSDIVSIIPGKLLVLEAHAVGLVKLIEVKGTAALEYFVCGDL